MTPIWVCHALQWTYSYIYNNLFGVWNRTQGGAAITTYYDMRNYEYVEALPAGKLI